MQLVTQTRISYSLKESQQNYVFLQGFKLSIYSMHQTCAVERLKMKQNRSSTCSWATQQAQSNLFELLVVVLFDSGERSTLLYSVYTRKNECKKLLSMLLRSRPWQALRTAQHAL